MDKNKVIVNSSSIASIALLVIAILVTVGKISDTGILEYLNFSKHLILGILIILFGPGLVAICSILVVMLVVILFIAVFNFLSRKN